MITNNAIKETTKLSDLASLIAGWRHSIFGHNYLPITEKHSCLTSTTSHRWGLHWHTSCYGLEASTALQTHSRRKLSCSRWKRTPVYPQVPVSSQVWVARSG